VSAAIEFIELSRFSTWGLDRLSLMVVRGSEPANRFERVPESVRSQQDRGRSEQVQSRTSDMHGLEESDRTILPMNQSNKEEQSSAEVGEERVRAKENTGNPTRARHRAGNECPRDWAVCDNQPSVGSKRFTALLHHGTVDLLWDSFAATGPEPMSR
jgi:hypothetical protein